MGKLPICERLRHPWPIVWRKETRREVKSTLSEAADTIEALCAAVETLLTAADHAGGLGGCDPELEAACRVGSAALAKARNTGGENG